MKKTCFYCPEDVFQDGGGATVAINVLLEYNNGIKNDLIVSKRTTVPAKIAEKYTVKKINYPKNKLFAVIYDLLIAPIVLFSCYKHRLLCLNSIVPLFYPSHVDVYFQMRMFYFEEFDTFSKKLKNFLGRMSVKRSRNVFVASQDHKNDIVKFLKAPDSKVHVAALGFDFNYKQEELFDKDLKEENYWLFISIFRPYKNIDGLIEAYAKNSLKHENMPNLKLVGDYPERYKGIEDYKANIDNLISMYKLESKIEFLGLQKHPVSMKYLANCNAFIFPSKFEGFGLPILEAMALEVPVLSSSAHSLSEVGGDTIAYFDPKKEHDLEEKMHSLLTEGYKKDITLAKQRSELYTWKNTCEVIQKTEK